MVERKLLEEVIQNLIDSFKNKLSEISKENIVQYCCENVTIRNIIEDYLKSFQKHSGKDSSRALQEKEDGNKKYSEKKYEESLLLYTKSIFSANKDDECLSLAYANRSLILQKMGHLKECLIDIDMALDAGYPKEKSEKLILRKASCLVELGDIEKARNVLNTSHKKGNSQAISKELEKLKKLKNKGVSNTEQKLPEITGGENEDFPYASKHLSVFYDEIKGRHVISNTDIEEGEVLFVEKPYAFVSYKGCSQCCKETIAPIPCLYCSEETYCSPKCRNDSWQSVHSFECGFSEFFKSVGVAHIGFRTILVASSSLNELKKILSGINTPKFKKGIVSIKSKNYDSVFNLESNSEKYEICDSFQYAVTALLMATFMKKETSYFPTTASDEDLVLVTSIIWKHILQVLCNGFTIGMNTNDPARFSGSGGEKLKTGMGIYPSTSMMNHSCDPSVNISFQSYYIIIRAAKAIKKGEEVFNCYGPRARKMTRIRRQYVLSKQYFFNCQCEPCSDEFAFDQIFVAFKCTNCEGPSVLLDKKEQRMTCFSCGHNSLCSDDLSNNLQKFYSLLKEGDELLSSDVSLSLRKNIQAWSLGRVILYKYNEDLSSAASRIAHCLTILKDYKRAIMFLKCCVLSAEKRFGESSSELFDELKKLEDAVTSYKNSCAIEKETSCRETAEVEEFLKEKFKCFE